MCDDIPWTIGNILCFMVGVSRSEWAKPTPAQKARRNSAYKKDVIFMAGYLAVLAFLYIFDWSAPFEIMPEVCQVTKSIANFTSTLLRLQSEHFW